MCIHLHQHRMDVLQIDQDGASTLGGVDPRYVIRRGASADLPPGCKG